MRIKISDIHPDGTDLQDEINPAILDLTPKDYVYFIQPLEVQAHVDRVEDMVLAKVKVTSRFKSFCARTLVPVEEDWTQEFLLDWEIDRNTEFIDIDDEVRQEILMSLPVRVLCPEEKEKERRESPAAKPLPEPPITNPEATHRPFENLKDIDE